MNESGKRLREHLDNEYPRTSKALPDPIVSVFGVIRDTWRRIGYFRYLVIAIGMYFIPVLMDEGALVGIPILEALDGGFGTNVLFATGVWILAALGLNVVVGLAGLLDLGYVAFLMLGAYTTALMTASGSPDQFHFVEWPTWAALPFAIIVAMIAGAALGIPTLRLRGDYLAIVTLGFHEIVRQTMNNLEITNGSRGIAGIPHPTINIFGINYEFGLDATPYWQFLLVPAIIGAIIMIRHLEHSRVGRYWTAIREDEVAAAAMGVPVVRMKVLAFVIGASTSGLAGWIYAVKLNYISPNNFLLLYSILVLSAVVVGGLGSVAGAVLGAVLVFMLPDVIRELSGDEILGFDPETGRIAIFGLILIIVMIFRPGGLLVAKRRKTELSEGVADDLGAAELESGAETHEDVRSSDQGR